MTSPGVLLAFILMLLVGLTHLLRPSAWRLAIRGWAEQGSPGIAHYGVMHVLPGALFLSLVATPFSPAEWLVIALGVVLTIKGTVLILLHDRAAHYLMRSIGTTHGRSRAAGAFGLALSCALLLLPGGVA